MIRLGHAVMSLMDSFRKQRLAVLSGLATKVCQSEWGEAQVEHPKAMKNPRVTREDLRVVSRVPSTFRRTAWLAPYSVRADVWDHLGGFDESLALSGEPGIGLDIHLSLRAGVLGYSVGVFGALFERGRRRPRDGVLARENKIAAAEAGGDRRADPGCRGVSVAAGDA